MLGYIQCETEVNTLPLAAEMGVLVVLSVAAVLATVTGVNGQLQQNNILWDPLLERTVEKTCPTNWSTHKGSCYKFIRSPVKTREQARAQCQVWGSF